MTEARAFILVTLGGVLAVFGTRIGLEALGATTEQMAVAAVFCLVATAIVGGFVVLQYSRSDKHR